MAKYQKYAEYKDSGVEWLGEIPRHWDSKPLKYLCTYNDEVLPETTAKDAEIQYIDIGSVSAVDGISKIETMIFKDAPSRARRIVRDGDVIVSTVRTYLEAIAPINNPPENLIVSTGFAVIRPNQYLYKSFASYCLRAKGFIKEVVARSVGVSYPAINSSDLVNITIPSIEYVEQVKIANFLDHETAKIDSLIAKQEKLIELLKEKRQAVISHAVTKGLNPDVTMKDSGVEWLGQVPEHWEVRQLRYLGSCQNGINIGAEYFGSGSPFISYGDVYRNPELPSVFEGLVQSTENDKRIYSVQRGDVLFTRTSETIEEIGFSSTCLTDVKDATFAGFLIRFRPIQNTLLPEYSKFYFRNILLRAFFVKEMNLVTRASLSQELLKKLAVPFSSLEEQKQIADFLSAKERVFDKLVNDCIKQIELLKERRTALISSAVTGKINVSNWQHPNEAKTELSL
jgi:type I restriction enzyme, S subunit